MIFYLSFGEFLAIHRGGNVLISNSLSFIENILRPLNDFVYLLRLFTEFVRSFDVFVWVVLYLWLKSVLIALLLEIGFHLRHTFFSHFSFGCKFRNAFKQTRFTLLSKLGNVII